MYVYLKRLYLAEIFGSLFLSKIILKVVIVTITQRLSYIYFLLSFSLRSRTDILIGVP